jgi:TonB family protein
MNLFNVFAMFLLMSGTPVQASDLPVLWKVDPIVPPIARRLSVEGTVRLRLTVSPNGHVCRVVVLGGNPILLDAATAAVKQWVYAPSGKRADVEVALSFRLPHPNYAGGNTDAHASKQ